MDTPPGVGGSQPKLGDLRIYARNLGDLRGMTLRDREPVFGALSNLKQTIC